RGAFSLGAWRGLHERDRRAVRGDRGARRHHLPRLPYRSEDSARAARAREAERGVRAEGAFRVYRAWRAAGVLLLLAPACRRRLRPLAPAGPDCFRRVVEFPGGPRPQQHSGLRVVTPPRSFPAFAVVFAVAFAVAYVVCVKYNYALFTYHPALNEFAAGAE